MGRKMSVRLNRSFRCFSYTRTRTQDDDSTIESCDRIS